MRKEIESYLESLRVRRYATATVQAHQLSLAIFERFLASRGVDDVRVVTREHIRDFQIEQTQRCSLATVHVRLIALRRFFEHLEKTDAVLINPCLGLKLPTLPQRLPKTVLTPGEARAMLDAPDTQTKKGIRDKAILELFYSTGIRAGEMANLTVHDVDYKNGFVRVTKGKFAKDRVVPLGKKACDYVREYLQKVRSEWSKQNRDERALWLCAIAPHGTMKQQAIAVIVRDYAKAAGITRKVRPHVLRHTCATHLVANGANVAYVKRLLGHRSLETTQRYTRVAVPEVKQTFKKHPRASASGAGAACLTREDVEQMHVKGAYAK
jgi:integrase/recombinase XerD